MQERKPSFRRGLAWSSRVAAAAAATDQECRYPDHDSAATKRNACPASTSAAPASSCFFDHPVLDFDCGGTLCLGRRDGYGHADIPSILMSMMLI
jgi:hypothetical protein